MQRKISGNNRRTGWLVSLESGREGHASIFVHAEAAEAAEQRK